MSLWLGYVGFKYVLQCFFNIFRNKLQGPDGSTGWVNRFRVANSAILGKLQGFTFVWCLFRLEGLGLGSESRVRA